MRLTAPRTTDASDPKLLTGLLDLAGGEMVRAMFANVTFIASKHLPLSANRSIKPGLTARGIR